MPDFKKTKKLICVVEDNIDIRSIYAVELQRAGYEVITAENGAIGLDIITKENPDLILLDLQMPVKNGFEVMAELKANETLSKIPLIILTNADDDHSIKEVGEKFETRFYIVKAFTTPKKLLGFVREALH